MAKQVKRKNAYKMPDPLPAGEVLTDTVKEQWKLGPSIGKGGFGEIYSAKKLKSDSSNITYVIKIEPHENGPLFVEMHFYKRNCKAEDVEAFKSAKKLKHLGVPVFIASGSHQHNNEKYRFIVMEKFGTDLWKLFSNANKIFSSETVYILAIQILNSLEYIHSKGYVHADIKASNLMLGSRKGTEHQVYLLDYGLACHYFTGTAFKPDPKKANNGTLEYLSTDAHSGVFTRRGDIEILLYNLIQWLGCKLPWEKLLGNPKSVQESKEKHLKDASLFMKTCFKTSLPPSCIVSYLKYLNTLEFNSEPDYAKLKKLFEAELKILKVKPDAKLDFSAASANSVSSAKPVASKRKKLSSSVDAINEIKPGRTRSQKKSQDDNQVNGNNHVAMTSEMLKYQKKLEEKNAKKVTRKRAAN